MMSKMADDIDAMLQGEDQKPDLVSQTEDKNTVPNPIENGGQTPEEVDFFNSLKGSSQERFKEMYYEKKVAEDKLRELQEGANRIVPPPPTQFNPDVKQAVSKLDEVGIATKEYTDNKINATLNQLRFDAELNRLESKYDGDNNEPKFSREEYQQFINTNPVYQNYLPEDVYKKMFADELSNLPMKTTPQRSSSLKPTKTSVKDGEITPEEIEERLKEPDGQKWYEQNLDKINKVLGRTKVDLW